MRFGERRDCNDGLKCVARLYQFARVEVVREVVSRIQHAAADRLFIEVGQRYANQRVGQRLFRFIGESCVDRQALIVFFSAFGYFETPT